MKISHLENTDIEFEDYASEYKKILGNDNVKEVYADFLSNGKGIHLYKEPYTEWPIEFEVAVEFAEGAHYAVTFNGSAGGGASNTKVLLITGDGTKKEIANSWWYDGSMSEHKVLGKPQGGYEVISGTKIYKIEKGVYTLKIEIGKVGDTRDVSFTTLDCIRFEPASDIDKLRDGAIIYGSDAYDVDTAFDIGDNVKNSIKDGGNIILHKYGGLWYDLCSPGAVNEEYLISENSIAYEVMKEKKLRKYYCGNGKIVEF